MEDSSKTTETVGASLQSAPTDQLALAELCRAYEALERGQTTPDVGLPFIDEPVLVLAGLFGSERASLVVDELWARRCIVVIDRELDPDGAETPVDGWFPERALLVSGPGADDVYRPQNRFWIPSSRASETDTPRDDTSNESICLIPNIVSSGDDDGDLAEEAEEGVNEEDHSSAKPPRHLALFQKALLPALAVLAPMARMDSRGCVRNPIEVLRETLRCHGITEDHDMEFVNWLVQRDYIFIVEIGPRVIWVREEAHALVGRREMIIKPADADLGCIIIDDDDKPEAPPSKPSKPDLRHLRGRRFSRDLIAAAVVTFIDVADDSGKVLRPIEHLEKVLASLGEDRERAHGLLTSLVHRGFVDNIRSTFVHLLQAALDFAEEWKKATELTLAAIADERTSARVEEEPDSSHEAPDAPLPAVVEEPPVAPLPLIDEIVEKPAAEAVVVFAPSEATPAAIVVEEPVTEAAAEVVATIVVREPATQELIIPETPALTAGEVEPHSAELSRRITLTPGAFEIMRSYRLAYPGQDAGDIVSALIIQHLGPRVSVLEAALERSYKLLLERRSKTRDHQGKPIVYTASTVLRCNPPLMSLEEATTQLACMAERGWIRWVHPPRKRDRRPQSYIVLLR